VVDEAKGKDEGAKRVKIAPTAKDNDNIDFAKNFEKLPATIGNILSGKGDANKPAVAAKPSSQPSKAASQTVHGKSKPMGRESKIPIMIVPAAPTAMLTLFNIKQFLEGQE
jgi:hypothetical protein